MSNPPNKPLEEDELMDILDFAKPILWHVEMLAQGKKPHSFETVEEAVEYYKTMYASEDLKRKLLGTLDEEEKPAGKPRAKRKQKDTDEEKPPKKKAKCNHCNKPGHEEDQCWTKHPEMRPSWMKQKGDKKQESHVVLAIKDLKRLVAKQAKKAAEKKSTSDEDMENFLASLNMEEDE